MILLRRIYVEAINLYNTDLVSMSEEIKSININDISPLDALQKLAEIQKKLIKPK